MSQMLFNLPCGIPRAIAPGWMSFFTGAQIALFCWLPFAGRPCSVRLGLDSGLSRDFTQTKNKDWGLVATSFVIVGLLRLGRFLHCPGSVVGLLAQKGADYSFRNIFFNKYSLTAFRAFPPRPFPSAAGYKSSGNTQLFMTSKRRAPSGVRACPQCGSADLESTYGSADPILAGTNLGLLTCSQCGRSVVPITFATEPERVRYAKTRPPSARPSGSTRQAGPIPGIALARMDLLVSILFSILFGAGLIWMGQPLIGGILLVVGILMGAFFLRR